MCTLELWGLAWHKRVWNYLEKEHVSSLGSEAFLCRGPSRDALAGNAASAVAGESRKGALAAQGPGLQAPAESADCALTGHITVSPQDLIGARLEECDLEDHLGKLRGWFFPLEVLAQELSEVWGTRLRAHTPCRADG